MIGKTPVVEAVPIDKLDALVIRWEDTVRKANDMLPGLGVPPGETDMCLVTLRNTMEACRQQLIAVIRPTARRLDDNEPDSKDVSWLFKSTQSDR